MTKCSLKLLEPEELMNQDLDVENLSVPLAPQADEQRTIPHNEGELYILFPRAVANNSVRMVQRRPNGPPANLYQNNLNGHAGGHNPSPGTARSDRIK